MADDHHDDPSVRVRLAVRPSRIDGAGQGLFVEEHVSSEAYLCDYWGKIRSTREAVRMPRADKEYLMKLGAGAYVDAGPMPNVRARYINDARNPYWTNVRFDKRPDEHRARVIALRDIAAGEELYASYGRWFWLAKGSGTVLPTPHEYDCSE